MIDSKETVSPRYNRTDNTNKLTETGAACTRPAQAPPGHNPRTEKGSGYKIPPLTKKLFAIDSHWEREIQFSSVAFHWVFQAHSKAGVMLKVRESTQARSHALF